MIKRITLLRRRPDLSEAAFRAHWATPHAAIARRFSGMSKYTQNRVQRVLWSSGPDAFQIGGVAELWFESAEAGAAAGQSSVTADLIEDEPGFLSGLTGLIIGESWAMQSDARHKFMIFGRFDAPDQMRSEACRLLKHDSLQGNAQEFGCDLLFPGFVRQILWHEPVLPNLVITVWYDRLDAARRAAFAPGAPLRRLLTGGATSLLALKMDELRIV